MTRLRRAPAGLATAAVMFVPAAFTPAHTVAPAPMRGEKKPGNIPPTVRVPADLVRQVLPSGRTYLLAAHWGPPAALVIGLPGTNLTAGNADATFWSAGGWVAHAARNGYTLALGETVAGRWDVGGGWPGGGQDDMAYLLAVVADAEHRASIDPRQVFVAGFSAGGAMAWRAVAARPDVFTAGGCVSCWQPAAPTGPVTFWHCHGTADTAVPVRGGPGAGGYPFPAAVLEGQRAPRGSRVVLYPTAGGHGTPGWAAGELWAFWTRDRLLP